MWLNLSLGQAYKVKWDAMAHAKDLGVQEGAKMFIRRTTYRMAPEFDTEDGQADFEREMRAAIRPDDIDGLINTSHVPNEDGTWSVVAIWRSEEQARIATPGIRSVWNDLSSRLAGPPQIEASGVLLEESY
ncbi:MAG: hypothetical protein OXH76_05885 [Boseongicola sp.]|nr:hypothetical protein [Boseongicola sp.]